ncbi:hypothetical protein J6590_016807 [Homalodisca vitripennis]|nr:hypothetical protein J6590_016807 [Homalodisca vitripennis]
MRRQGPEYNQRPSVSRDPRFEESAAPNRERNTCLLYSAGLTCRAALSLAEGRYLANLGVGGRPVGWKTSRIVHNPYPHCLL